MTEETQFYTHEDPLVLHLQRTWCVPASIGGPDDHASWADADCRDPAAVVVRLLVRKLHGYELIGDCDAFDAGLLSFQASALKAFGPEHAQTWHQYSLDLQALSENTDLYAWRFGKEQEAFARKIGPLVSRMRTSLAPLLLARIPERVRNNVEDSYAVSAAVEVPTSMRVFAFSSLRRGHTDPTEKKGGVRETEATQTAMDTTPGKKRPDKRTREANAAMPTNTRVLLNLAYAIITYIQKNGPSPELIEEARSSSLAAANQLAPGEPRFIRLMASLNELTSAA